jgi:hypothetical protein
MAIQELRRQHLLPEIRDLPDYLWQMVDCSLNEKKVIEAGINYLQLG